MKELGFPSSAPGVAAESGEQCGPVYLPVGPCNRRILIGSREFYPALLTEGTVIKRWLESFGKTKRDISVTPKSTFYFKVAAK
ncbi:hypothetical protein Y1Q_0008832 [Alligator mississippiensis]|uniref:Uncharacterized protein n=1 Tax=Alligator mississippiensis TaxID=8496 RepID=A0A151NA41_ALLMI|nr:hypothetical protein Y1Q_0008832 [Alligator mississippiensis]